MNNYTNGLVSVVIPTYKRSKMLTRALDSVIGQTYRNIELLLVNDNEPDDEYSEELKKCVEKYQNDNRFRLINQAKHINGAVARNVGIKQAKGEYIAFLDDDDWWKPQKLERQLAVLNSLDDSWGGVSCRIEQYDNDKRIAELPKYNDGYVYKNILMLKCDLATSTLVLRHKNLDDSGYFDENLLRHQDYQLLVNFTSKFKLKQIDELLHCCDVSDLKNRPNGDSLLVHKQKFFESVNPIMEKLNNKEKNCVRAVHNFEVGYVYLKEKKVRIAISYMIKVMKSFDGFVIVTKKIIQKMKSSTKV